MPTCVSAALSGSHRAGRLTLQCPDLNCVKASASSYWPLQHNNNNDSSFTGVPADRRNTNNDN